MNEYKTFHLPLGTVKLDYILLKLRELFCTY